MNQQHKEPSKKPFKPRLGYIAIAAVAGWFIYNLAAGGLLSDGSDAPAWTLKRADGEGGLLSSEELKGKVTVLDFWSPYCPPCVKEIPILEKAARRLKNRGVEVIGIAAGGEDLEDILEYAKDKKPGYPWVADVTGVVSKAYLIKSLPTIYILDRQGKVAASHSGYWPEESLLAAINKALEK